MRRGRWVDDRPATHRGWWVGAGVFVVAVVLLLIAPNLGNPASDSANEKVLKRFEHDNRKEPWMKHVTDSDPRPGITVTTDYPPDRKASWLAAYEICLAVKRAYAKDANELPDVVVNGTETRLSIRVDGSKDRHDKDVPLATSSRHHDFICGITPPKDDREAARKLDIPVYLY